MRKLLLVTVVFVALVAFVGFNLIASATAHAQTTSMDGCVHQPTIDTLQACVDHAADQGFINNSGVTRSLLAKLDSAENALSHGRTSGAINTLNAFISEVRAQSGKYIVPIHAVHLVMHAQLVIHALENM
jgi:hypothetical protein